MLTKLSQCCVTVSCHLEIHSAYSLFFLHHVFFSLLHTEPVDKRYIWAITHCFVNSHIQWCQREWVVFGRTDLARALLLLCYWTCKYRNKCTSRCKWFPWLSIFAVSLISCCKFHAISYSEAARINCELFFAWNITVRHRTCINLFKGK